MGFSGSPVSEQPEPGLVEPLPPVPAEESFEDRTARLLALYPPPPGSLDQGWNAWSHWGRDLYEAEKEWTFSTEERLELARCMQAARKAESGGNPYAIGDAGASVGLYMLHSQGVGHGLSVEQRYDVDLQYRLMYPRFVMAFKRYWSSGYKGRQLAIEVGREAERPVAAFAVRYGQAYDELKAQVSW